MFARRSARTSLLAARVGMAPRLVAPRLPMAAGRYLTTSATPVKSSFFVKAIKEMPVDVYPLAILVSCVVTASIFSEFTLRGGEMSLPTFSSSLFLTLSDELMLTPVCGYHLKTDKSLRLLPQRAKSQ